MTTNRECAAVARKAAELIQDRGKATRVMEDGQGRLCAIGALWATQRLLGYSGSLDRINVRARRLVDGLLSAWSDLPATTEQDIAKLFLQVADNLETEDDQP